MRYLNKMARSVKADNRRSSFFYVQNVLLSQKQLFSFVADSLLHEHRDVYVDI